MAEEINLVDLQSSTKPIRNPFGFDFKVAWAGRPYVIKGDGQWYNLLKPLRDHAANRLYMKIRYQYHDEQVALLKDQGRDKAARQFNVPRPVENKIWRLITGEDLPGVKTVEEEEQEAADLTALKNEISKVDAETTRSNQVINVSALLEKANLEALADPNVEQKDSSRRSGTGKVNDVVVEADGAIDPNAVTVQPVTQESADPVSAPVSQPEKTEGEFAELGELDNATA